MTKEIDIAHETQLFKEKYQALAEKYESIYRAPADERLLASERLRAAYCVNANKDIPIRQTFKHYVIDSRVWQHFLEDSDDAIEEKKMSRAEKQAKALRWAAESVGKTVTLEIIMAECDVAYSMAKKLTEDRPDVFRKIKRGQFEIRDPKADREADKAAASKEAEEN
jgi:hypothetical protein